MLITKLDPSAIYLQGTFLRNLMLIFETINDTVTFTTEHMASRDVIVLKKVVPQSKIDLKTDLQAAAMRVTLHTMYTLYIPSHD